MDASTGRSAINFPASDPSPIPPPASILRGVWGIKPEELPQPGYSAQEIMNAIHRGEIKGLLSLCFNPLVSLPDANFTREALSKLEFFGVVDFFLSETAHHADVVMAGSLQEEEEGLVAAPKGESFTGRTASIHRVMRVETRPSSSIWRTGSVAGSTFHSRILLKYSRSCESLAGGRG